MNHYVYKIEDVVTGEFYIGSRECKCAICDDRYMGSPKVWKPIQSNLIKNILKSDFIDKISAIEYESKLISENIDNELNRNYYIPNKGFHFTGAKHKASTIEKMKANHSRYWLGKHLNDEHKMHMSESLSGKTRTEEQCKKIGDIHRGKIVSDHTRKLISDWHTGRPLSAEHKASISRVNKGKIISEETRIKIGDSKRGKKRAPFTDIAKQHMSEVRRGSLNHNFGKHLTDTTKQKISDVKGTAVIQYSLSNEFIKEWKSIHAAYIATGAATISNCCKGKLKTSGGYIWAYKN